MSNNIRIGLILKSSNFCKKLIISSSKAPLAATYQTCVSSILGLPIVVITSYPSAPHFSFFPVQMNYSNPIYIAFNHTSPGHYDGTKGLNFTFCYYLKQIPYIVKQWFPALHLSFYHTRTNLKVANH